ncbi:MAG TPA: carotenoid oxygenase family protein [Gammaproteobacteria bacterium]|nr:carotenoid oxygenase family protein [Gammaproteobacteria bacterium]
MLSKIYTSQLDEKTLEDFTITGDIPPWLSGSFISNGPAQFEIGNTTFNHWFDGFAMLKKFEFDAGHVTFQNRFLRSEQYVKSHENNKLFTNEFGTYASNSLLDRIKHAVNTLRSGGSYDNCNVNISSVADCFIAMTESTNVIEFDLSDLSTIGPFKFKDRLRGHTQLAHPHIDNKTGETINVMTEFGKEIKYHIYKIKPNSKKRELIKTYISAKPFYMHSFSITANYVILFKSPFMMNQFRLMLGLPFNSCVSWQKNTPSYFIIIDRKDGSVREIEAEPFLCFHSVNAYENNHELLLDLICYEGGNPYAELTLANLKSEHPEFHHGELRRYMIDLNTLRARKEILSTDSIEFPRLNYKKINGENYNFMYTAAMTDRNQKLYNALQKNNIQTGHSLRFEKANTYFGEAVFIPKPDSPIEDDGILLSIVFNTKTQCSSLVMLDAQTMQQRAEISLPFHLPLGLHGNFFSRTKNNVVTPLSPQVQSLI